MQGFSQVAGVDGPLEQIPAAGKRKVVFWASVIAVGGFLFGYDTGVVSGALLYISAEFDLNSVQQGSIVSVLLIGAMIGAMSAGRIADRLGRRKALGIESAVFIVGTLIAVAAQDYWLLLIARLVLGLAVGAASATVPVYLSEISPAPIRGRILSMNQLMITVGIVVSYLVDFGFSGSESWRAMFAVGLVPAVVLCLGMVFVVPESYAWLLAHGHVDEARKLVTSVAGGELAERVIQRFRQDEGQTPRQVTGVRALLAAPVRPALIVGVTLAAIQQFGGINTIIYFAPTIIENTGLTASNSIFYSVFIGLVNLIMTVVSIGTVDRFGRRLLLVVSLLGMLVAVTLLGLSFIIEMSPRLSLVFMVLYIASFAGGLGPVFWVIVGEIFPPQSRAAGSSAATTVNWFSNFVVSQAFLPLAGVLGQGQTFLVFGVICLLGLLFVTRFVPETKNRGYDEIDTALRNRFGHGRRADAAAGSAE
ncbi:sugar porter (SP) family MFS transporter [Nocardia tenerifensis]|uniref:Sugar porter (SP) family MFS transporter n=1 Tax=Nocardia tenerifensis TaxID=228006 RepID=A0A318KQ85_9NOCA|nr:sugar porter family MFS transporter [Nocardia tenerifensis]PXX71800.1 sugar porter (SP) family MFS transporter [Nocardia tenerifensis]